MPNRSRFRSSIRVRVCLLGLGMLGAADAATIMLSNSESLSFGVVVAGPVGGAVTITPSGILSCAAGLACLPRAPTSAATFSVSGDPSMIYVITLPPSATLKDAAGDVMTIDSFVDSVGGSSSLDAAGEGRFSVGATLHVAPDQPMGAYTGTFDVTVEYQ